VRALIWANTSLRNCRPSASSSSESVGTMSRGTAPTAWLARYQSESSPLRARAEVAEFELRCINERCR
jgi:hypothetical protein